MATHHIIAINGDSLSQIEGDPEAFVKALARTVKTGGADWAAREPLLFDFGTNYLAESMNGTTVALQRALAKRYKEEGR